MTFVVSWAEQGVAEARAELDGAAIGAAAAHAVTLWPEEPESEPGDGYRYSSQVATKSKPDDRGAEAEADQPRAADGDAGAQR